jgi:tetratricopeptide (TPR) repeat protein
MSDLDVDTRSDIYSLGVLLYELLTGTTPFDKERFRRAGYDEIRRIIREEEPPRPSTRLSTLGQAASTIASQRQSDPRRLSRLVRGELDWIVMKCLEKDRNRRYETASALAADVMHYLHDEPVQACPPSAWYKLRKFARRQKRALAMAACVVLAVAGLAGGVGWVARDRAARQEAGTHQAEEALTAARAFFGENRLDLARRKLTEAQALRAAHHVAPGSLAEEIGALEDELVRFEQFFAFIDQARQAEIPSRDEVALAGQGAGGTVAVLSRKLGQEREPARAVPFLLKALALYEALGQKDWSTALGRGALGRDQVEQIRRTAYEELLWLADDLLARREDHQSGEQLSAPAAARQALAYLDQAAAAHQPTTAFISLRARSRSALGDREAADADARLIRATPPTLALDHVLLGQAALDAREKEVAIREFEEALRLEPTHYWSMIKLGQAFNELGEGPADFAAAVAVYIGCIMKRPDYAPAYRYRARAHSYLKQYEKSVQDYTKATALDPTDVQSWNGRGAAYIGLQQHEKALAELNKAIELDPKLAAAWNNRAVAYNYLHQYDKALADLNKATELDPKEVVAWSNRGAAYNNLRQYDKALADFNKAIELDPRTATAWNNRGSNYNGLHQYDKAIVDSTKAIELDPKFAKAWSNRGVAYIGLHQYDKAIIDSTMAIELAPKDEVAWSNRGAAYIGLHRYHKALADLNKAIELNPKHAAAWRIRGAAYIGLHQHDKALADFSKAIELDPNNAAAWSNRGIAYRGLHRYHKAIADYSKAIELDPNNAAAWSNRGAIYCDHLAQYDKALADFNKALELNPKSATAWSNRGAAYNNIRQYDKALADFNKALELDPNNAAAWNMRGNAYCGLHQHDKALADFSKALELDPNNAAAWSNRGAIYCDHLAQYDKALADFNKAIELNPKSATTWNSRGWTYNNLRQYDKALADCSKAIELDPRFATAWNNRGWTYNNLHQYDKALADLSKAIELDPNNARALNTLAWLFATCANPRFRDAGKAVRFAQKAVELAPANGSFWNTLGAAHYRAGEWKLAVEALNKSIGLRKVGNSYVWFFLAMAHWQLGQKEKAHKWFDRGVQWMEKNAPQNEELRRFRAEATQLLEVRK